MKPNVYREYFARWASLRSAPTYKALHHGIARVGRMDIGSQGIFDGKIGEIRFKNYGRQYQIRTGDLLDVDQAL